MKQYVKKDDSGTIVEFYKGRIIVGGMQIFNPPEEIILAAGWEVYVPPMEEEPEYVPQTEPDFEQVINAVKTILAKDTSTLSDEDALSVAALYPTWSSKIGESVSVGERLWYDSKLYRVVQAHIVQEEWKPNELPALYTEVSIVEIPEWVQPTGAQDAYKTGDKVSHNGSNWESIVDSNVWEPGIYGWSNI